MNDEKEDTVPCHEENKTEDNKLGVAMFREGRSGEDRSRKDTAADDRSREDKPEENKTVEDETQEDKLEDYKTVQTKTENANTGEGKTVQGRPVKDNATALKFSTGTAYASRGIPTAILSEKNTAHIHPTLPHLYTLRHLSILVRHGTRHPVPDSFERMRAFDTYIRRVLNIISIESSSKTTPLHSSWVSHWSTFLSMHASNIGALTNTGRREMRLLAVNFYSRYFPLLLQTYQQPPPCATTSSAKSNHVSITITTTNKPRVIESAKEFFTTLRSLHTPLSNQSNCHKSHHKSVDSSLNPSIDQSPFLVLPDQHDNYLRYHRHHSHPQYATYTSAHRKHIARLLINGVSDTVPEPEDHVSRILSYVPPETISRSHATIAKAKHRIIALLNEYARSVGMNAVIQETIPTRAIRGLAEAIASHHALSTGICLQTQEKQAGESFDHLWWTRLLSHDQMCEFECIENAIRPFAAAHQVFPYPCAPLVAHISECLRSWSKAISGKNGNSNDDIEPNSNLVHIDANFGHAETIAPLLLSLGVPADISLSSLVPYGANVAIELFAATSVETKQAPSDGEPSSLTRKLDSCEPQFVLGFRINEQAFVPPALSNVSQRCRCVLMTEIETINRDVGKSRIPSTDDSWASELQAVVQAGPGKSRETVISVVPLEAFLEFADSLLVNHIRVLGNED